MESKALLIEERLRSGHEAVRPADFRTREAEAVDPRIVLENPNISLYCLDLENRQALFVETPPQSDLSRAPFLYEAQYAEATRLIRIPYATLHRLAAEVAMDPSRLILLYSVGRCGSTLVSRVFEEIDPVESISEPDVFTQMLAAWGADDLESGEKSDLLRSCMLLQCVPGRLREKSAWAVKFRSMVTAMGPFFHTVFPEAKVVFLYRNAVPWSRSYLQMTGATDPLEPTSMDRIRFMFGRGFPEFESGDSTTRLELAAAAWGSQMENCLNMQRLGIPMFVMRYEELNSAPRDVLARMLAYCGVPAGHISTLDAVLAKDSQAGSSLSRATLAAAPIVLSDEHVAELRRLISQRYPNITADTVIPGTYFPST